MHESFVFIEIFVYPGESQLSVHLLSGATLLRHTAETFVSASCPAASVGGSAAHTEFHKVKLVIHNRHLGLFNLPTNNTTLHCILQSPVLCAGDTPALSITDFLTLCITSHDFF